MMENRSWFGDMRILRLSRAEKLTSEALIVFHGFPGQPPVAEVEKYRNAPRARVEIAKAVVASVGMDVYLPSYEGLGESRGSFNFMRSVTRSADFARDLSARYRALHILGHSWGGFVGFNVHRALGARAGRLALLAGLLDLPDRGSVLAFLPEYVKDYPEILGSDDDALERAAADLDATRQAHNPMTLAAPLPAGSLLLAHGRRDSAVPLEQSRRFHSLAGGRLLELEDDHVFSLDMPRLIAESVSFFSPERGS